MSENTSSTIHGFVVFPSPTLPAAQWTTVKASLERTVTHPGASCACCGLQFAEAPEASVHADAGSAMRTAAAAYRALQPPQNYNHSLFLYVDEPSAASILAAEWNELPEGKAPYVLAVEAEFGDDIEVDPEAEGADFRGWFKAGVRAIAPELIRGVKDQTLTPFEMAGHSGEDDVWMSPLRFGLLKGAG